ncbi:MAG: sulfur carrier protein ThiS [Planctomycetaceae bacterium]
MNEINEILVNEHTHAVPSGWTIRDLLVSLSVNNRYCAVERNRELVPREMHAHCSLQAGDQIEIVTLVGGG